MLPSLRNLLTNGVLQTSPQLRHERPWRRGKIAGSCSSGDISAAARVNRNAGGTVECASADVGGIESHLRQDSTS